MQNRVRAIRVDFSLRREVFFVIVVAIVGALIIDDHGEIINSLLNRRLRMLARDLVVYGSLIRGQFLQDIIEDDLSDTFAARYKSLLQEQEGLVTTK